MAESDNKSNSRLEENITLQEETQLVTMPSKHQSPPSTPSTLSPSPLPVIPPIITCERDRLFLIDLNNYIDSELADIEPDSPEQRYTCFKSAFEKVVEHVDAYKPLLTAIKAEYEDIIDKIKSGRRESMYLNGKLKSLASEASTTRNYRRRGDELEQKMGVIDADNERLRQQLTELQAARAEVSRQSRAEQEANATPRPAPKRDARPIPGLTLQQSTDVRVLKRELEKLERQLRELGISHRTRYSPAQVKDHLKGQLEHKVALRDQLAEQLTMMKAKRYKLKIAVEAAQAYLKIQPPHQTIGEAVVTAIIRANNQVADKTGGEEGLARGTPSTTFEDDDPTREKEAEMMLEYIEKFNELLEDGLIEQAAVHAANSPKGILRTPETLNRFKEMAFRTNMDRTPMLAFCEALMSTVSAYGIKPTEVMSQECVKCALEENRLDLLVHWISQDRLTLTEQLGKTIDQWCELHPSAAKRYLSLTQTVYKTVGAHVPAVVCMLRQGRLHQAVDYARTHLEVADYVAVLHQSPSQQLVQALYPSVKKAALPLGALLTTLLKTDSYSVGLGLVDKIHSHDNKQELGEAVFADDITTKEEWEDVGMRLQDQGMTDAALHLLAVVTTSIATKGAFVALRTIQREQAAEEKQREAREEQEKLQLGKKGKSRKARHQAAATSLPHPGEEAEGSTTGGDTPQATARKVKRVEISDTVEVQNDVGQSGFSSLRVSPIQEQPRAPESVSTVGTLPKVITEKPGALDGPESSALDSSMLDDKTSKSGMDSDYHGSGGETSESEPEFRRRRLQLPPRVAHREPSTDMEDEKNNEGYEADVE